MRCRFFLPYQALSQEISIQKLKEDAESGRDGAGRGRPKLSLTWLLFFVKYKLAKYHPLVTNTVHLGNTSQLTVFL